MLIPPPPIEKTLDQKTILYKHQENILIPQTITNHTVANSDFEIYLGGVSSVGGLMIGSAIIVNEEDENKKYKNYKLDSTFPYFIKFTRENIPVPLQNNEYVEFVGSGARYLIIITKFSNCYLFGNFFYEGKLNFCKVLQFKMNDDNNLKNLDCKITHLVTAPYYIVLKDEFNRFWYCGKTDFGIQTYNQNNKTIYYNFIQLNIGETLQQELNNKNNKITKVVTGDNHVMICINDKTIYGMGRNENCQLGIKTSLFDELDYNKDNINEFYFVKADWNENGEYTIKQLECSCDETIFLTNCGKIFKSDWRHNNKFDFLRGKSTAFQSENTNDEKPIYIGVDCRELFFISETNKLFNVKLLEPLHLTEENLNKYSKIGKGLGEPLARKWSAIYCDKQIYFTKNRDYKNLERITFKTEMEIKNVNISAEINLVFCFTKKSNLMKQLLFNTKEFTDIDIHCFLNN